MKWQLSKSNVVLFGFLFSFILMFGSLSRAENLFSKQDITYNIEPVFGIETVYRTTPKIHTVNRSVYGVRLSAGSALISAEGEYLKGSDSETYLTAPQTIKYNDEKFKLGAKTTMKINDYIGIVARLGCQAKQIGQETITNGVSVNVVKPIEYDPYAGAALTVRLGRTYINIGSTAIIKDIGDLGKTEYQNSISASFGL
jgi:hypothetical protein